MKAVFANQEIKIGDINAAYIYQDVGLAGYLVPENDIFQAVLHTSEHGDLRESFGENLEAATERIKSFCQQHRLDQLQVIKFPTFFAINPARINCPVETNEHLCVLLNQAKNTINERNSLSIFLKDKATAKHLANGIVECVRAWKHGTTPKNQIRANEETGKILKFERK